MGAIGRYAPHCRRSQCLTLYLKANITLKP